MRNIGRKIGRTVCKSVLTGVLFTAASLSVGASHAQPGATQAPMVQVPQGTTQGMPNAPVAKVHNDPKGRYSMTIPPEATMSGLSDASDAIRIQSRKGYIVNVQAGPNRPMTMEQMAQQLEQIYLGDNKPWRAKLNARFLPIAGLPALENIYQGSGARVMLIIARGKQSDFVMIFNGPERTFDSFSNDFKFLIDNFVPAKAEINKKGIEQLLAREAALHTGKVVPAETVPQKREINPLLQPSMTEDYDALKKPLELPDVRPQTGFVGRSPLTRLASGKQQFFAPEYGYSIEFPGEWILEKPGMFSLLISGPQGTESYLATVGVQNVMPGVVGEYKDMVASVVKGLKADFEKQGQKVTYYGEKYFDFQQGQINMNGYQFLVTYNYEGTNFRKWVMLLPRARGGVVHVWSYTAPEAQFNTYRPVAEEILKSWSIQDNG